MPWCCKDGSPGQSYLPWIVLLKEMSKLLIFCFRSLGNCRWFWNFKNINGYLRYGYNIYWNTILHESRGFKTRGLQFKIWYLVGSIFSWFCLCVLYFSQEMDKYKAVEKISKKHKRFSRRQFITKVSIKNYLFDIHVFVNDKPSNPACLNLKGDV